MLTTLLLTCCATLPQQDLRADEAQLHYPPTFEEVFGAGAKAPANVGKNLRFNRDNTTKSQNEYSIAINPKNPNNILASANDYRTGRPTLGRYASLDGGKTVAADGVLPLAGWTDSGDPSVGFDGHGNGYIMGLHFVRSPLSGALFIHKTSDGGKTFQTPIRAFAASGNLPDKPLLTIDQRTSGRFAGSLYITFTGFFRAPTGLQCIHSRDQGKTWSRPVRIGSGQGTSPAIGPNGEVYVSWYSNNSILFNSSLDGGASWRGVRRVATISRNPSPLSPTRFRCNSFPSTTVDRSTGPFRGRIHVCWSSRSGGSSEIFASYSSNGGTTWSSPVRVNDATQGDQYFQWMASDEAGAVFACWHDRRADATNRSHECYASASYDGGRTWTKNWKASETSNNPGTATFLGDYNGMDALRGRAYATWVDLRNGNQDLYTAAIQTDLEFSPTSLSASAGGTVQLPIKAGPARQGRFYLLLANATGVGSGIRIGQATLWLKIDPLLLLSIGASNFPPFLSFQGLLRAGGIPSTQPRFTVPAGLLNPLVGNDVSFAYLLLDAKPDFTYGSNPVSVRITR